MCKVRKKKGQMIRTFIGEGEGGRDGREVMVKVAGKSSMSQCEKKKKKKKK